MKRVLLFIFISLIAQIGHTQSISDINRIIIHPIIPSYEHLPAESSKLLETKLLQIVTANGIMDNEHISRFVITAKVNVISKDILVGPPQRISQKIDVTLMIGDIEEDKVYSSYTLSCVGIGQSLDKAYIAAFKNINPNNQKIKQFIEDGKEKIIQYYELHCRDIISEAKKLASTNQYEQALLMLTSIPNVCEDCYNDCADIASELYVDMINVRGAELLRKAQSAWSKNPTREGAKEATRLLSQINFASNCQKEVSSLMHDITEKMKEIDNREWEFKMQQYKDDIEREKREWAQHLQEYKDEVEREKREFAQKQQEYKDHQKRQAALDTEKAVQRRMLINACRDVAMEYARHQPNTINYYSIKSTRIYAW